MTETFFFGFGGGLGGIFAVVVGAFTVICGMPAEDLGYNGSVSDCPA